VPTSGAIADSPRTARTIAAATILMKAVAAALSAMLAVIERERKIAETRRGNLRVVSSEMRGAGDPGF
jgi:hypothetical protein